MIMVMACTIMQGLQQAVMYDCAGPVNLFLHAARASRLHYVMLKYIVKHRIHCCAYACDAPKNCRATAHLVAERLHAAGPQEKITAAVDKITPHKRCYAGLCVQPHYYSWCADCHDLIVRQLWHSLAA